MHMQPVQSPKARCSEDPVLGLMSCFTVYKVFVLFSNLYFVSEV